jgi:flagellin
MGTTITGQNAYALVQGAGSSGGASDLSVAGQAMTLTITGAGLSSPKVVTLNTNYQNSTNYANASAVAADITTKLNVTGLTVTAAGGKFVFTSTAGAVSVSAADTTAATLTAYGLNATAGTSSGTTATVGATYSNQVSSGTYEMASTSSGTASVSNFLWNTAVAASGQTISVAANDASGAAHTITVNLDNTSGATVTSSVGKINDVLQKSNDSTLQQVSAVAVTENGVTKINFVSTLPSFSVSIGKEASGHGITDASGNQGVITQAAQVGTGGSADISTLTGAQAAVTAVTNALSALGKSQANIGKGENVLSYAINLAQSQITNYSAAESQIRDANVAQEAANLTKAQVLQQASIAAMAQANSAPQAVLSLLRG